MSYILSHKILLEQYLSMAPSANVHVLMWSLIEIDEGANVQDTLKATGARDELAKWRLINTILDPR